MHKSKDVLCEVQSASSATPSFLVDIQGLFHVELDLSLADEKHMLIKNRLLP